MRGLRVAIVALTMGALVGGRARAETPEAEVERLAAEAVNAYRGADYKRAVELLQRAYDIRQVPALLYNMGKAYDKLGDVDHAFDAYQKYVDSAAADPRLKGKAEARIAVLAELKRKKAVEARAAQPPPPAPAQTQPPPEPPKPVGPTPEELRARAHDDFVRDRHRARLTAIVVGGATVAFAAVALGLSVDALDKEHQFNATTNPDAKASLKSQAQLRAGVADGFWCATAVAAAVTGYFAYKSFRHEPAPPSVALVPAASPAGVALAAVGSF